MMKVRSEMFFPLMRGLGLRWYLPNWHVNGADRGGPDALEINSDSHRMVCMVDADHLPAGPRIAIAPDEAARRLREH